MNPVKISKLQQIVRLRQMLRKWRGVARMGGSRRQGASGRKVPAGHVAVCVGEARARFVVKTAHLNHAIFGALLKRSEEEFGFQYEGVLAIPCDALLFQHLLSLLDSPSPPSHLPDLLDFYISPCLTLPDPLDFYLSPCLTLRSLHAPLDM